MEKIFINAESTQIGRIGSFAAKHALRGDKVIIVNCEKAIISGNKTDIIKKYKERRARGGSALKGPNFPRDTERVLKRCVRGMLPDYRRGRGRDAWKKIRCFNNLPEEYKKEKLISFSKGDAPRKHIVLEELKQRV